MFNMKNWAAAVIKAATYLLVAVLAFHMSTVEVRAEEGLSSSISGGEVSDPGDSSDSSDEGGSDDSGSESSGSDEGSSDDSGSGSEDSGSSDEGSSDDSGSGSEDSGSSDEGGSSEPSPSSEPASDPAPAPSSPGTAVEATEPTPIRDGDISPAEEKKPASTAPSSDGGNGGGSTEHSDGSDSDSGSSDPAPAATPAPQVVAQVLPAVVAAVEPAVVQEETPAAPQTKTKAKKAKVEAVEEPVREEPDPSVPLPAEYWGEEEEEVTGTGEEPTLPTPEEHVRFQTIEPLMLVLLGALGTLLFGVLLLYFLILFAKRRGKYSLVRQFKNGDEVEYEEVERFTSFRQACKAIQEYRWFTNDLSIVICDITAGDEDGTVRDRKVFFQARDERRGIVDANEQEIKVLLDVLGYDANVFAASVDGEDVNTFSSIEEAVRWAMQYRWALTEKLMTISDREGEERGIFQLACDGTQTLLTQRASELESIKAVLAAA